MNLGKIRIDGGTQPRAELREDTITEYAEAMAGGALFPPVDVFYDGADYWLADGFHRWHAAKKLGLTDISAQVHQGTLRDAVLFSASANAAHGMRRTNEDKRRAVMRLLEDPEWGQWSDSEIAKRCAVSHVTVGRMRKEVSPEQCSSERTYITRHGTVATMNTANIGATQPEPEPYADRPAPTYGHPRPLEEHQAEAATLEERMAPTEQERYDAAPEAKAVVTLVRQWQRSLLEATRASDVGKLSPEARRFAARRFRQFADELMRVAGELEQWCIEQRTM